AADFSGLGKLRAHAVGPAAASGGEKHLLVRAAARAGAPGAGPGLRAAAALRAAGPRLFPGRVFRALRGSRRGGVLGVAPAVRAASWYALLGVPAQLALGLAFALLLHSVRRGRGFFRAVFFAPYVAPAVAVSWVWSMLLSPHLSLVNQVLYFFGFDPQPFLNS